MTEENKTDTPNAEEPEEEKGLTKADPAAGAVEAVEDEGPKRFVEKGPHVLLDTQTNLYWMKKDSWLDKKKFFNWHEGKDYAVTKNVRKIGGFNDWRMPTPEEASTLYHDDFANEAKGGTPIHIDKAFPEGSFKVQWVMADTSTKRPRFDFTEGKVLQVDEYAFGSVRLVRRDPVKRDDKRIRPAGR